jgi:hypothetical protein
MRFSLSPSLIMRDAASNGACLLEYSDVVVFCISSLAHLSLSLSFLMAIKGRRYDRVPPMRFPFRAVDLIEQIGINRYIWVKVDYDS